MIRNLFIRRIIIKLYSNKVIGTLMCRLIHPDRVKGFRVGEELTCIKVPPYMRKGEKKFTLGEIYICLEDEEVRARKTSPSGYFKVKNDLKQVVYVSSVYFN